MTHLLLLYKTYKEILNDIVKKKYLSLIILQAIELNTTHTYYALVLIFNINAS